MPQQVPLVESPMQTKTKNSPKLGKRTQRGLAKLNPPTLRAPIIRNRLFAEIDRLETVTWISGPSGIGKTTLLASYLAARNIDPVWLDLDADDKQPTTFFYFLRMAFEALGGCSASPPDTADRHSWQRFARQFARQVLSSSGYPTHWVFDNVQEVAGGPIEDILAVLAAEVSGSIRIFVLSHQPPAPAFADMLSKQRVHCIDAAALAFSVHETTALIAQLNPHAVQSSARIYGITNGWPAAIVLLSAQHAADVDGVLACNLHESSTLFSFLAQRVYERLPVDLRAVLDVCAWLPEFDAETAVAASQMENAGELLSGLQREGFFIERRVPENAHKGSRQVFQIHRLFSEFLRLRAIEHESAAAIAERRVRAAELLERASRPELAISAYLDADLAEHAERVILQAVKQTLAQGRHEQVIEWIGALPVARLEHNPWLAYWLGIAQSYAYDTLSRQALTIAHKGFTAAGDRAGCVMTCTAALCAAGQSWGSLEGTDAWLDAAIEAYSPDLLFADADMELNVLAGLLNGHDILGRAIATEDEIVARIIHLQRQASDVNIRLLAAAPVLSSATGTRRYEHILTFIDEMNLVAKDSNVTPARSAEWLIALAFFYANCGYTLAQTKYLTLAHETARTCKAKVEEHGLTLYFVPIALAEMSAARNAGDIAAAERFLLDAGRWTNAAHPRFLPNYYQCRALLALLQNNPHAALADIHMAIEAAKSVGSYNHVADVFSINEATSLFRTGRVDEALSHVAYAANHAPVGRAAIWRTVEAFFRAHHAARCCHADAHALTVALFSELARLQHFNAMLYAAPEITWLCAYGLQRGIEAEFIEEMIRRRMFAPPDIADESWPWPVKIRTLGGFSVEVNGVPVVAAGKAQKKPIEMLTAVAARGASAHQGVGTAVLIADLWPDENAEDPKGSFDTTVFRLRKLVPVENALRVVDGRVVLNNKLVWLDTAAFETLARRIIGSGGTAEDGASLVSLYRGPFLANEESPAWRISARERFSGFFVNAVAALAPVLEAHDEGNDALLLYEHALRYDNLIEPFYRGKMRIHLARGEHSDALLVYRRCKELLLLVLGVSPSTETDLLRAQIHNAG